LKEVEQELLNVGYVSFKRQYKSCKDVVEKWEEVVQKGAAGARYRSYRLL
jgi:hypothetical protein